MNDVREVVGEVARHSFEIVVAPRIGDVVEDGSRAAHDAPSELQLPLVCNKTSGSMEGNQNGNIATGHRSDMSLFASPRGRKALVANG